MGGSGLQRTHRRIDLRPEMVTSSLRGGEEETVQIKTTGRFVGVLRTFSSMICDLSRKWAKSPAENEKELGALRG